MVSPYLESNVTSTRIVKRKTRVESYTYPACQPGVNQQIITLTNEGLGIRSTARVLRISATNLLKRIVSLARGIPRPVIPIGKSFEVDEIRTYLKRKDKLLWIVYALERKSKEVAGFCIGARTNGTLDTVLKTLYFSGAKRIYTDGLSNYRYLLPRTVHRVPATGQTA